MKLEAMIYEDHQDENGLIHTKEKHIILTEFELNKVGNGCPHVVYFPGHVDDGTYLEPIIRCQGTNGKRIGTLNFLNRVIYHPKKYNNKQIFEVALWDETYNRNFEAKKSQLESDLNAWWQRVGLPGNLTIVDSSSARGMKFVQVELKV